MAEGSHTISLIPSRGFSLGGRYIRLVQPPRGAPAPSDDALRKLAEAMILTNSADETRQQRQEGGVPSGYTYLAQFVAHDLSFNSATMHQRQLDQDFAEDFRTPRFDLDAVYGRGPVDQPYLYETPTWRGPDGRLAARRFVLGPVLDKSVHDLPRVTEPRGVALIGDPRNDQNAILSQLHGAFLHFHNRLVDEHEGWDFERVQQSVRLHYQHVVLEDLLPRLVGTNLLSRLLSRSNAGYKVLAQSLLGGALDGAERLPGDLPVLPLEFAVAAFRFGHSMVRPSYKLTRILPSFDTVNEQSLNSLVGFPKPALRSWRVQWDLFVDLPGGRERVSPQDRLQMAYSIDASIAAPLNMLPPIQNLAERNLLAGRGHGLASGQAVARFFGIEPLDDASILIGNVAEDAGVPITKIDPSFAGNCPLWTYVLAEAHAARLADQNVAGQSSQPVHPRQLGELGGRLVAETFLALLRADRSSILHLNEPFVPEFTGAHFGLGEFLVAALKTTS